MPCLSPGRCALLRRARRRLLAPQQLQYRRRVSRDSAVRRRVPGRCAADVRGQPCLRHLRDRAARCIGCVLASTQHRRGGRAIHARDGLCGPPTVCGTYRKPPGSDVPAVWSRVRGSPWPGHARVWVSRQASDTHAAAAAGRPAASPPPPASRLAPPPPPPPGGADARECCACPAPWPPSPPPPPPKPEHTAGARAVATVPGCWSRVTAGTACWHCDLRILSAVVPEHGSLVRHACAHRTCKHRALARAYMLWSGGSNNDSRHTIDRLLCSYCNREPCAAQAARAVPAAAQAPPSQSRGPGTTVSRCWSRALTHHSALLVRTISVGTVVKIGCILVDWRWWPRVMPASKCKCTGDR